MPRPPSFLPGPACVIAGLFAAAVALAPAPLLHAQDGGGGDGGGGDGGGGGGDGGGNNAGVMIDPAGAFMTRYDKTLGTAVDKKRREALAESTLPADLNRPSESRKVSLRRLEESIRRALAAGETLSEPQQYLAGLTRVDYVFVRPPGSDGGGGDVVLAGPAGGFAADAIGRVVSNDSGRPTLRLADLLAAVRAAPGEQIGCSIDPVPQRQAAMASAVAGAGPSRSVAQAKNLYRQLADILGDQTVRVFGVPPGSPTGVTLVEADYRMKLIALGLEPSNVRGLPSHLSTIRPGANSAQRWWFVPSYEPVLVNADRTAFALSGPRIRLLAQDEVIGPGGAKTSAGRVSESNEAWANRFSEAVPQLVEQRPVFAALQNVVDLAVVAELVRGERLAARVGWSADLLTDPRALPIPEGPAPRTVKTAFNTKSAGRGLVIGLIGGGVTIRADQALRTAGVVPDRTGRLDAERSAAFNPAGSDDADPEPDAQANPDEFRWWWD